MKNRRILIDIPVTHDEKMGLDLYDIRFAYNMFFSNMKEFETYNDMLIDGWNDKQKDYANDQR